MSKGIGQLQRQIVNLLPDAAGDPGPPRNSWGAILPYPSLDNVHGLTTEQLGDRLYTGARPSQWKTLLERALRSLEQRGLASRRFARIDPGAPKRRGLLCVVWRRGGESDTNMPQSCYDPAPRTYNPYRRKQRREHRAAVE